MNFHKLGNTAIDVSQICLGTMTWGEQNTETEAHNQLDAALAAGINFIDTAELYPVPPKAATYTRTEQYIGSWLAKRTNRDQLILATKIAGKDTGLTHIRNGKSCFDRGNIQTALNDSLRRLQTDYIDLYQLHWPDRRTNFFGQLGFRYDPDDVSVPISETLQVIDGFLNSGKIRHYGLSNETPWGAMHFVREAERLGMARPVSIQNPYNLLNRSYEIGLAEVSHREQMGLLAYSPLAFGVLSGKYLGGARPADARLTLFERFSRYTNPNAERATQRYVDIAREHGLDPAQMALAYVNSRSFLTSTIIGATSLAQLASNLASIELTLDEAILQRIEAVHQAIPNPCP